MKTKKIIIILFSLILSFALFTKGANAACISDGGDCSASGAVCCGVCQQETDTDGNTAYVCRGGDSGNQCHSLGEGCETDVNCCSGLSCIGMKCENNSQCHSLNEGCETDVNCCSGLTCVSMKCVSSGGSCMNQGDLCGGSYGACCNPYACCQKANSSLSSCEMSCYNGNNGNQANNNGNSNINIGGGWNVNNYSMFGLPSGTISGIISNLLQWFLVIFGMIGIIGFIISGILYLTAAGSEDQITKAKTAMKWSIVGVVVGLIGLVILYAVTAFLGANPLI